MTGRFATRRRALIADTVYDAFVAVPLWLPLLAAGFLGVAVAGVVLAIPHATATIAEEAGLATAAVTLLGGMTGLPARLLTWGAPTDGGEVVLRGLPAAVFTAQVADAFRLRGWAVEELRPDGGDAGAHLLMRRSGELLVSRCDGGGAAAADDVDRLVGALASHGGTRGVLVTAGDPPAALRRLAADRRVDVLDGPGLLRMLPPAGFGETRSPATVTCPECGGAMTARPSRFGSYWSCASFPACRGTQPLAD